MFEATTPTSRSKKWILGGFKALLGLLFLVMYPVMFNMGRDVGKREGIDFYHQMCYNGGIIIDEENGTAVQCQPLGVLSNKELDNMKKGLYNKYY